MLLKQGSLVKLKLLVYLIVKKKEKLMHLARCYGKSIPYMREQTRELPWETYLEDIKH